MQKFLSYIISPLFCIAFFLCFLIFHPVLWLSLKVFGHDGLMKTVSVLNWCLMRTTNIIGTQYQFTNPYPLPTDRPLIIVCNHQSLFDIPPIIWYLRKNNPKFVSKKELGKGIPSVSFNLNNGGSVLIDRKDGSGAIKKISELGSYIEKYKRSAVIFPEGTRSKDGHPKPFKQMGLKILLRKASSALIVPISINNSWELFKYGKYPLAIGIRVSFNVHKPIENIGNKEDLISETEAAVKSGINSVN